MPAKSPQVDPKNAPAKEAVQQQPGLELSSPGPATETMAAVQRARQAPHRLSGDDLGHLQPLVGNLRVRRLVDRSAVQVDQSLIPIRQQAPPGLVARNPDFTPEEVQTWCREWLRTNLPAGFFELRPLANLEMTYGATRGSGAFQPRVAFEPRQGTIRAFTTAYNRHFPTQELPRGPDYRQPRRRFLATLSEISLALTLPAGAAFVSPPPARAAWGRAALDAAPVQVGLLAPGGPVTLSAALSLDGQALATISHTTHVVTHGVNPEVAGRVLSLRRVVESVCAELGMRPDVVMAIISKESGGIPGAAAIGHTTGRGVGRSSHIGLMAAGSPRPGPGQTLQQAVDAYVLNVEQQIRDGIAVFQAKQAALQRSPYNFTFFDPLTEYDLAIIEMAYSAGEGTMLTALRRARSQGRQDWQARDIWIPAIIFHGSHEPSHGLVALTRGWDRDRFAAELVSYVGLAQTEVDREFPPLSGAQATERALGQQLDAMRARLVTAVSAGKARLRQSFDANTITMSALETQDLWVFRSAEYKYRNIDPGGPYITEFMRLRRYYASVLGGRWAPLETHIIFTDEETRIEEGGEAQASAAAELPAATPAPAATLAPAAAGGELALEGAEGEAGEAAEGAAESTAGGEGEAAPASTGAGAAEGQERAPSSP